MPPTPTAGGALHWAPLRPRRAARAHGADRRLGRATPRRALVVVDVSVEVTVAGARDGRAGRRHGHARRPRATPRTSSATGWPTRSSRPWPGWADAARAAARVAREDACGRRDLALRRARAGRPRPARRPSPGAGPVRPRRHRADRERARRRAGGDARTGRGPCSARPATAGSPTRGRCCCAADVVVTHAGQNAIAEVAAARRPAVVVAAAAAARRAAGDRATRSGAAGLAVVLRRLARGTRLAGACSTAGREPRRRATGRAGTTGPGRRGRPPCSSAASTAAEAAVRTAVITPVAGRHGHLRPPACGAAAPEPAAAPHVVVAMGDGEARRCRAACGDAADVVAVERPAAGLPLAAGAQRRRRARARGAAPSCSCSSTSTACPAPDCSSATARPPAGRARHCSAARSRYLPPAPRGGYPATGLARSPRRTRRRPAPPDGVLQRSGDHALFWSLSFAVTRATWRRIGGFSEAYVGYGGEDTDFGQLAAARGRRPVLGRRRAGRTTSTIRSRRRPSSTSTTSCATPRSSATAGAGGRWRAGCRRSPRAASPTTTRPRTPGDATRHLRAAEHRAAGRQG